MTAHVVPAMVSSNKQEGIRPVPEVVTRAEIPAIHTVFEGGREHVLGILKEFRRHDRLGAFLARPWSHTSTPSIR
jgi:hypothetical protein